MAAPAALAVGVWEHVQIRVAMNFETFQRRAHEIFAAIPPEYREGVDALEVTRTIQPHPTLPEVFTLGECKSEFYPSEFGGPGEVRSAVVLYYGSFLELARREEEWDWEGELWETITHEVRHHLESLAADDALEVQDYAEDQNFARREGQPFDPFFFRFGIPVGEGEYEVDGDRFVELPVDPRRLEGEGSLVVRWSGGVLRVAPPDRLGDVHFVRVGGVIAEPGELFVVLMRKRGVWQSLRALWTRDPLEVLESERSSDAPG